MGARLASLGACCALLTACSSSDAPRERIFVSQAGSATIAVLDSDEDTIRTRIEVGMLPHQLLLTADGKTLYAVVVGSQSVAEIDVASATLRRTMLTAPVPMARADGTPIVEHVSEDAAAHTTCFDCHRPGGAEPKYAGVRPFAALLAPDERSLLVASLHSADLTELELGSGTITRTVHLVPSGSAVEPVALARLDDEIWVALRPVQPSTEPGALRRLDAATLQMIDEVPTGADPAALLALAGRGVLVSNFESDTVSEHRASGEVVVHQAAPGPYGLTALPDGRVLTLDYYSNSISVLDMQGGSFTMPLPHSNPTHAALATDGASAWLVTSGTDAHLVQLELDSMTLLRDLPIDGLSFDVALTRIP